MSLNDLFWKETELEKQERFKLEKKVRWHKLKIKAVQILLVLVFGFSFTMLFALGLGYNPLNLICSQDEHSFCFSEGKVYGS